MALRRIQPIEIPRLTLAEVPTAEPRIEWVSPTELLVDEAYQRTLHERSINLIRRLVANWDWRRFKPPIVVKTEHGYEVIDGQHTSIAAATRTFPRIPVLVVDAAEMVDRAAAFLGHNRDRLAMTPMQLYFAAVAAQDPEAMAMDRVCRAAGVRMLKYGRPNYKVGESVAVGAIRSLVNRCGEEAAITVLRALVEGKSAPVELIHVKAAEALIVWPAHAFDPGDVTTAILKVGPDAKSYAKEDSVRRGVQLWDALMQIWRKEIPRGRSRAA